MMLIQHNMIHVAKRLFLVLLIFTLTNCGFKLRDAMRLPPQLHTVYLQSQMPYSDLTRDMQSQLNFLGVKLVDNPKRAPVTLALLNEKVISQKSSLGSSQNLRNYIVTYQVVYAVKSRNGKMLIKPTTVSDQRTITAIVNEELANSSKLVMAKQSMRKNVINKIVLQLNSEKTKRAICHIKVSVFKHQKQREIDSYEDFCRTVA